MKLELRPPGKGNHTPLFVTIEGKRSAPLFAPLAFRRNQRIELAGIVYRISKVHQ